MTEEAAAPAAERAPQVSSLLSQLSWNVPKIRLRNFETIQRKVNEFEDLRIDPERTSARARGIPAGVFDPGYDTVDLRAIRVTSVGTISVPGQGILELTPHSKRQLGSTIGVKWDVFFGAMQDPEKIQRALMDHLRGRKNPVLRRIVARQHRDGDKKVKLDGYTPDTDGILRGFVSPGYSEIRDARLFDRIEGVVGKPTLADMGFALHSFRDNGTHYMLVFKEPVDMMVGSKGKGSTKDVGYFGIRFRNSEVGAYALTGQLYIVRFVCTNGMITGVKEEPLLYRQHRGVSDKELDKLIEGAFGVLPKKREETMEATIKLHDIPIKDAKKEIESFLHDHPKWLQEAVRRGWDEEPIETAYGVMQAIARVAMASRRDRDKQLEIEMLAGSYMRWVLRGRRGKKS